MNDDTAPLRRYAETRQDADFATLVDRHLGLVYHAALRQLAGDTHHARDAAQAVFTDLARKAPTLAARPFVLAGWLHTATRHACARIRRAEHRRRQREDEAARMNSIDVTTPAGALPDSASAEWDRLRPVIDEALHALATRDREAVLLRFFEGRAYAEIGERLALSEAAARRRVDRALEKLRVRLARHGVVSTASALGLALGAQAGLAPPAGLAATISAAALASLAAGGGAVGGGLLFGLSTKPTLAASGALLTALALGVGFAVTRPRPTVTPAPPVLATPPPAAKIPLTATDLLGTDYLQKLRGVSAADLGRLLVELWALGTPPARTRFREVFDLWCQLDPEAASRWAVITRTTEIGRPEGQVLREQAVLIWAGRDPDAACAWALTEPDLSRSTTGEDHRFYSLFNAIIAQATQTDPTRALALAHRAPAELRSGAVQYIFQIWAKTDPVNALQALKNEPTLSLEGYGDQLIKIWSKHAPEAAARWILAEDVVAETRNALLSGLTPPPDQTRTVLDLVIAWWEARRATTSPTERPALSRVLRRWAETNAEDALEFADALPDDLRTGTLVWAGIHSGDYGTSYEKSGPKKTLAYDPVTSLAFLALLPEGYIPDLGTSREQLTNQLLRLWAEIDPGRVAIWTQQQLTTDAARPEQAAALGALARQDLGSALTTWEKLPPGGNRESLSIALALAWSEKDPEAALKWVSTQNLPLAETGGLTSIIGGWMSKDPETALAWAETDGRKAMLTAASYATQRIEFPEGLAYTIRLTPDPKLRLTLLGGRARDWLRKDRAAATKFLTETPLLTPGEKTTLLELAPEE